MDQRDSIIFFTILHFLLCVSLLNPITNGFGFDSASSSCSQKVSRRGRAQLLKSIPCNLSQQSYCNLPGSSYPWHAVRRFVHENQGLMKRMYGDIHHISVLRSEIHNNNIDIEKIEEQYQNSDRQRRKLSKYLHHSDYQNLNRANDVLSEPYFRPASASSSTTTTTSTTIQTSTKASATSSQSTTKADGQKVASTTDLISSSSPANSSNKKDLNKNMKHYQSLDDINMDDNGNDAESIDDVDDDDDNEDDKGIYEFSKNKLRNKIKDDNNLESNSVYEISSVKNSFTENNFKAVKPSQHHQQQLLHQYSNKSESSTIPTTLRVVQNLSVKGTGIESPLYLSTTSDKQNKADIPKKSESELLMQKINENIRNVNESLGKKQFIDQTNSTRPALSSLTGSTTDATEKSNENTGNNGDKKKNSLNKTQNSNTMMEGQLFQDTVNKEIPTTNLRGVNACPVKEEVVAPFWANNTRGEVLALLNLYPFEQYVHWERCTNEHRQMYCRDGCRCEQQYSLHRLLAYDPRDECRGIFSDWFRFPSCCVCKCYNIPLEFRATSRSPRSDSEMDGRKNPIDLAEAEVHRAIYEHATEDWYRPRDEFDLNYDYID